MHLLVDEDTQARTLIRLLGEAGHDVVTAAAAGLNTMADAEVLAHAGRESRVLLTRNCRDFHALNIQVRDHSGILAVFQDADPSKRMSYAEMVGAIGNLEGSGVALAGEFVVLNAWRW